MRPLPLNVMLLCLACLACCGSLTAAAADAPEAAADALVVSGGWVRETPPNRAVAAGYLTLGNGGERAVVLVGAEGSGHRVELHTMRSVDGMMRMRPLERLEIPAGGSAALAPGGDHLMLYDVDATRAGTLVEIELLFEDGSRMPVTLPVRRDAPAGD